jgi:hypothetical protein
MCESSSPQLLATGLPRPRVALGARGLAVVSVVLWVRIGSAAGAPVEQSSPIENGLQLRDCLLPEPRLDEPGLLWGVSVRALPAFDAEWLVVLRAERSGGLSAELVQPIGYRIVDQLGALGNDRTCQHARETLRIGRCGGAEGDSIRVRSFAEQFLKQEWPARPAAAFVFDGTWFDVHARGPQEDYQLFLVAPARRERNRNHPVIAWAESLREALSCSERRDGSGSP